MKNLKSELYLSLLLFLVVCDAISQTTLTSDSIDDGLKPVPFNEVILQDKFWKPRMKTQMEVLVPFALDASKRKDHILAAITHNNRFCSTNITWGSSTTYNKACAQHSPFARYDMVGLSIIHNMVYNMIQNIIHKFIVILYVHYTTQTLSSKLKLTFFPHESYSIFLWRLDCDTRCFK